MMSEKIKLEEQSGAALIIALIMIVVLTLIGLASTFNSTYEIKLSGNKRASTDAFYITDSRLKQTENHIRTLVPKVALTTEWDPATDIGFSDDERKSGLNNSGPEGEGIKGTADIKSYQIHNSTNFPEFIFSLPSGQSLADTTEIKIYPTVLSAGTGVGAVKAKTYIIDALGTDQITSLGLFKSRSQLRSKIMIFDVTTEESQ